MAPFALVVAALAPDPATIGIAAFLLAAAAHSAMNAVGGGWRCVHGSSRPIGRCTTTTGCGGSRPSGVRYDGTPEDPLLAVAAALPLLLVLGGALSDLVVALVVVSAGYALVRKRLVGITVWIVPRLPAAIRTQLPSRYHGG